MSSAIQNNVLILTRNQHERAGNCQACTRKGLCPANARPENAGGTSQPVQKVIQAGKTAYEAWDNFSGIYIVRSGFFKSYSIDADGATQIKGFYLPGEFFGMDGIEDGHHKEYVEALDTSSVCKIPFESFIASPAVLEDAGNREWSAHLMLTLVKLMSRTISRDHEMFFTLGKMTARRRLGSFLLDLSRRMAQGGYSSTEFRLCMSRTDIASHLCLAVETVSRLFTQLQVEGAIEVDRRNLRILDKQALELDDVACNLRVRTHRQAAAAMQ
jgi:CRP/FNR family transcriptional regulator, anaerobic regulatory protein